MEKLDAVQIKALVLQALVNEMRCHADDTLKEFKDLIHEALPEEYEGAVDDYSMIAIPKINLLTKNLDSNAIVGNVKFDCAWSIMARLKQLDATFFIDQREDGKNLVRFSSPMPMDYSFSIVHPQQ